MTADQLCRFLEWLRASSKIEIGDQQYLAAYELLELIAVSGRWPETPSGWMTLLGPVLCSSASDLDRFQVLFESWFGETGSTPRSEPNEVSEALVEQRATRWELITISIAFLILLGGIFVWYRLEPSRQNRNGRVGDYRGAGTSTSKASGDQNAPGQLVVGVADPDGTPVLDAEVYYAGARKFTDKKGNATLTSFIGQTPHWLLIRHERYSVWLQQTVQNTSAIKVQLAPMLGIDSEQTRRRLTLLRRLSLLFLIVPLVALCAYLVRLRLRALEIRKWTTRLQFDQTRMGLQDSEQLIQESDIRKLAIELRKRRTESSSEIDSELTVDSTARMAGWFTPVNLKRGHEPEYLILEERRNLRDHQPRSHDELFGKLRDHDVSIDRYFFQTDPRNCSDAKSRTFAINELSALHSAHQLWLILEPERCIDPLSGLPERWFAEIGKWKERVLLSVSVPPASLETNNARPNRRGIQSLVFVPEHQAAASTLYPSLLRQSAEKWLDRAVPSEAAQLRLIAQLRLYLGPRRFVCLQACAVYPAIIWNVTRALVGQLLDRDEVEDALDSLIALPWFRYGTMPDWLRARLVNNLGERENEVRKALKAYLEAGSEKVLARDGIDIAPAGQEFLRRYGQLDDYIYLSFVSRHRLAKLSVQSPSRWRRLLRYSLVFRASTAIVFTALAIVGLQTGLSRLNRLLVKRSQSKISITVRPSEPFVASMLDVASVLNAPQNGSSRERLQRYSGIASDLLNVYNPLESLLQNPRITPEVAAELPDVQVFSSAHPESGMIWVQGEDAGLVIESGIDSKRQPWSQNSGNLFFMRLANLHLVSRSTGPALEVASAVSHGEIRKRPSSKNKEDLGVTKGNSEVLTLALTGPVSNPITCSSGPFHEGAVFDWSFKFSPSVLRIDRSDGRCWGNFELSGTQWTGEMDCNNGAAYKNVSLSPNSTCTRIASSLVWLTFDAGTIENARLTANAPAQVQQAYSSATGVASEPVRADGNSVTGTGILSPDRKLIAFYDGPESMLTIKDASSGRFIRSTSVTPAPRRMAWSPMGTQIAFGKVDGTISVLSMSTGQVSEMIGGAGGSLSLLAWSPDGQRLAAALETGLILIYDVQRREMTAKIFDDDKAVRDLTWSPDSRRITVGGLSGPRTWDAGSGTLLLEAK